MFPFWLSRVTDFIVVLRDRFRVYNTHLSLMIVHLQATSFSFASSMGHSREHLVSPTIRAMERLISPIHPRLTARSSSENFF